MKRSCSIGAARMLRLAILASACGGPEHGPGVHVLEGRDPDTVFREGYARPTPPKTAKAWTLRAEVLRQELLAHAGLGSSRQVPAATVLGKRTFGRVVMEDLLIDGFEGTHIPAALYLPTATGPVPGVVLNVGHDAAGQNASYIRTLAWRLAQNGVAALTLDWWGMGARFGAEWRHVPMGLRSIVAGVAPCRPVLKEPLLAFDYLAARPELDPTRIGMAGQSGGGMVTMHLAALEPRVAAAVVVDIVASNPYMFEELPGWGDPDAVVPGSLAQTSHGELLGLVAPRPLMVLSGDMDVIGPTDLATEELSITRAIYRLLDAPEGPIHRGFPTAHCYCEEKIAATLAFLGEHLVGAPIVSSATPPAGSSAQATPPEGDASWLDLINARWFGEAPPPRDRAEAMTFLSERWEMFAEGLGFVRRSAAQLPGVPDSASADRAIVWLSDDERDRSLEQSLAEMSGWLVLLEPAGMDRALELAPDDQRYMAQRAIALGSSVLALGAEDVVWAADGLRLKGVRQVIAVCDGAQASLVCLTAAALAGDAIDGVVVRGLVTDLRATFALGEPDPSLNFVTPGLGSTTSSDLLVAMLAPRPAAVVDPTSQTWPYAVGTYEVLGHKLALDVAAADLVAATLFVLRQ